MKIYDFVCSFIGVYSSSISVRSKNASIDNYFSRNLGFKCNYVTFKEFCENNYCNFNVDKFAFYVNMEGVNLTIWVSGLEVE